MAAWKGIIGRGFRRDDFKDYVATLTFTDWRPQFAVVHNTSAPRLSQWHSHPGEERMRNLESYYRDDQKWPAGPHLFIADDLIWVFTPLITSGVHSPSWNGIAWGLEMVGEYEEEAFAADVRDNTVEALAVLHLWRGLDPATIRFHKEDPKTTHKECPGKNVDKTDLIARVQARMNGGKNKAAASRLEHQPQDNYLKIGAKISGARRASAAKKSAGAKVGAFELQNALLASDPALREVAATNLVLERPLQPQRIPGIATVQQALNILAAKNPELHPIELGADDKYLGFFGEQTQQALRAFQTFAGVEADGKVGDDTLCALDDALEAKPKKSGSKSRAKKSSATAKRARKSNVAPDGYRVPAGDASVLASVDFSAAKSVGENYREKFAQADRGPARDDPSNCKTLLRFPDGTIFFDAKMAICTDGSPRGDRIDPSGQTETAHSLADGQPFNAEKIPYVVLPMPDKAGGENFLKDMGLAKGDLAMVLYAGERCGAILAELGPVAKIGETSVRTHELLPVPSPWKTPQKNRITNVSVADGVLYFVFPGTAALAKQLTSANAAGEIARLAEAAFQKFLASA